MGIPTGPVESVDGFTLIEVLMVVAVLAMLALLTWPHLVSATGTFRVELAAQEAAMVLQRARIQAIRRSRKVAVRFTENDGGRVHWTLHADGDGDGVLARDVARGVDPALGPTVALRRVGGGVRLGFPPGIAPRDPGDPRRRLRRLDDPIRFNRSNAASFGPLGGSTPGSLYFTDGRRALSVVRLYGRTGKIKVLTYDPDEERWHR